MSENVYLSTREVMLLIGWNSRASVSYVAKRENWRKQRRYVNRYCKEDVEQYILDRDHTLQAKKDGLWPHRGLIRHSAIECPICKQNELH